MSPLSMSSPATGPVSTAAAMGIGSILVGQVPGDPAAVRAVATDWKQTARRFWDAADLADYARGAAPSFQGVTADAFRRGARELTGALERNAQDLEAGVGPLEAYARVLDSAIAAADELREFAGRSLLAALGTPAAAIVAAAVVPAIAQAWAGILAEVNLTATHTAAALNTASAAGASVQGAGAQAQGGKGKTDAENKTPYKQELSDADIERIKRQLDGGEDWDDVSQGELGDCYLMATLQAYSWTDEGKQVLRENVRWDESKQAFIVTLYDDGEKVEVEVTDVYTYGNGQTDLIAVYERAYGKHFGDEAIRDGGQPSEVIKHISGNDSQVVDTIGWKWGVLPQQQHEYTDDEWRTIEQAVEAGKPVVASTGSGNFDDGDQVTAMADTNDDGVIRSDDENEGVTVGEGKRSWKQGVTPGTEPDEEGQYRIVGGDYRGQGRTSAHAYTVVAIDDETVTLYNPWGRNDTAGDYSTPSGDLKDGYIQISRADYEKFFGKTTIEEGD
ncbi:Calpain family cysteine protease [Actinomyces ruminicola]|uniref:Calpain family cysteine protease n=1 Tax=Actinomyces ruminicola TaxID=332524 RepID=A0A1H0E5N2_9ACTO|nr:C2 family cysteine protease [Actinomyces ruminicola]SDN77581.1 Calpain family cysteine protease [Actinomyces ruminicola]